VIIYFVDQHYIISSVQEWYMVGIKQRSHIFVFILSDSRRKWFWCSLGWRRPHCDKLSWWESLEKLEFYVKYEFIFSHIENHRYIYYSFSIDSLHQDFGELYEDFKIMWGFMIVTTFLYDSVIGNALSRNPSPGQVVARINILASEGWGSRTLNFFAFSVVWNLRINKCIYNTFLYKGYKRILKVRSLELTV
jgi:hypothetical protein